MNGVEWVVEAHGCDPGTLCDVHKLEALFDDLTNEMSLHPLGKASWHTFPGCGGVTGVSLLSESHLACHTFPEYGSLCLNVFCCKPRPEADFEELLRRGFHARAVQVRKIERPYSA